MSNHINLTNDALADSQTDIANAVSSPKYGNQMPIIIRSRHLNPVYLSQFDNIQPEEYDHTGLVSVIDDCMRPKLIPDSDMLVVLIEPEDYGNVSGIVLVILQSQPGRYFTGRIFGIDEEVIHLSRDNPTWPGLSITRSDITSLCEVRRVLNVPAT